MALPKQDPMSKRRIRGTPFYTLRNYYALAAVSGFCLISVPLVYFSNFLKNCEAVRERLQAPAEYIEAKKFGFSDKLISSSKQLAERDYRISIESVEYADLTKHDHILKDDKPGIDDI